MDVCNLMEDEVIFAIKKLLKDETNICTCEKCISDIRAIALNNLPPKYVVTEKGKLYEKVNQMNYQFDADVMREVTKAIEIVKNNPQH